MQNIIGLLFLHKLNHITKMKKLFLITLLIIPLYGISQTKPIESFLGIKFGSDAATVKAAIKAKGGLFLEKKSSGELLAFTNVKLGHRSSSFFAVKLINNKAFEADFFFDTTPEAKTIEAYNALVSDINDIYGKGESIKTFKQPYKDGDGFEITAIHSGNADYKTFWESGDNSMTAIIDDDLSIELTYQNGPLADQAIKKLKAKEKSDF